MFSDLLFFFISRFYLSSNIVSDLFFYSMIRHYLIVSAVTNLLVNILGVWFFRSYARVNIGIFLCYVCYHVLLLHYFYCRVVIVWDSTTFVQFTGKLKIWTITRSAYMFLQILFGGLDLTKINSFCSLNEVLIHFLILPYQCRSDPGILVS